MKKYKIFNHSSESMSEISSNTIDLVITDPPWNMGLKFGERKDIQKKSEYNNFITTVTEEIFRVLKNNGLCVFISADKVRYEHNNVDLAQTYIKLLTDKGFILNKQIPVTFKELEISEWGVVSIEDWDTCKNPWAYSQDGKILIFAKDNNTKISTNKNIENKTYVFEAKEGHPCPTSYEMVIDLLDTFYTDGAAILDPFMGTATLGVEVIKRGGMFYGYELDKNFYQTAKNKLDTL